MILFYLDSLLADLSQPEALFFEKVFSIVLENEFIRNYNLAIDMYNLSFQQNLGQKQDEKAFMTISELDKLMSLAR